MGKDARLAAVKSRMSSRGIAASGRSISGGTSLGLSRRGIPSDLAVARAISESKTAGDDASTFQPQAITGAPGNVTSADARAPSEELPDTDGLDEYSANVAALLQPVALRGQLTEVLPPVLAFGDSLALWPDGSGVRVDSAVVSQVLEWDALATPALAQITEAAEELALRRAGHYARGRDAAASGVWEGKPAPVTRGNARRLARRAVKEWHAGLVRAAPPGAPGLPLPVDAAGQAGLAAAVLPPPPAPSPLEQTCARLTVGPPRRTADQTPCALGLGSERGAKPVAALPASRLRNFDFPEDGSPEEFSGGAAAVADDPSLLIRVVRPLGGDSGAAALALAEPSTLQVRVCVCVCGGGGESCRATALTTLHSSPPRIDDPLCAPAAAAGVRAHGGPQRPPPHGRGGPAVSDVARPPRLLRGAHDRRRARAVRRSPRRAARPVARGGGAPGDDGGAGAGLGGLSARPPV